MYVMQCYSYIFVRILPQKSLNRCSGLFVKCGFPPSFIHFCLFSAFKVDVSGAYESLPHDKLIEVIGQALSPVQDELFTIRRYAKIWADSHEGLKKSFVRQVPSHKLYTVCLENIWRVSHVYHYRQIFWRITWDPPT